MDYIYVNGELYHYGIKGMKWGVRRYQKKDGSLTSAGKKRYSEDTSSTQKSTHRSRLEAKYREKGMSQREAEIAADKRIKTEKIIAITAGITVTAAAAYVVNNHIQQRTDHIIKSGMTMQRISASDTVNFDHDFYISRNKIDNIKYRGKFGRAVSAQGNGVNKIILNADKDIHVVSNEKARDTFVNLYKNDPEFRTLYNEQLRHPYFPSILQLSRKIDPDNKIRNGDNTYVIPDKILRKHGYDAFNISLADHRGKFGTLNKKFYSELISQGYDAVEDLHDKKYTGYKTKTPTIIFNAKDKVSIADVEVMTKRQIQSDLNKSRLIDMPRQLMTVGSIYAGMYTAGEASKKITVKVYKHTHPNTKLTDAEIIAMYYEQGK